MKKLVVADSNWYTVDSIGRLLKPEMPSGWEVVIKQWPKDREITSEDIEGLLNPDGTPISALTTNWKHVWEDGWPRPSGTTEKVIRRAAELDIPTIVLTCASFNKRLNELVEQLREAGGDFRVVDKIVPHTEFLAEIKGMVERKSGKLENEVGGGRERLIG